ncbi:acyl-CoA N-acyltransferase [Sporormia fimetaria CBS 119925]|uniref:Acyl-CoA N-acyltransferase n=1 Tax=Sporormia fimetaria CBS 119925 TaxID=1340428 RepID=A0A6A6UZL5_9PLEO|nr:acyl-CoA N-acyltransferase [Sporormia fimetaria CBS 119925]
MSTDDTKKSRIPSSDLRVEYCTEADAEQIAVGMYEAFGEGWWGSIEPQAMRPPLESTRVSRLAKRVRGTFSNPDMHWLKAVYVPTNSIAGIAGWMGPDHPFHNIWLRSAAEFFGWAEKCKWSEADMEDMWAGTDKEAWDEKFLKYERVRKEIVGEEKHWYLAPLFTFPEFQGKGVASLLLRWAIEKADATDPVTPLYLESSLAGYPIYKRFGFVPIKDYNMLRRGPLPETDEPKEAEADKA